MTISRTVCLLGFVMLLRSAAAFADQTVWESGFETGFPGREWLHFDDSSYSPTGSMPANRTSAWTIVNRASGEPVYSGNHAYKGWIAGPSDKTHRAYPVIHTSIPTPLINTFMVYLDVDYARMSRSDWVHFGTWGNHDPDTKTGNWALHTMSVRDRRLEFAHVSPFEGEYIGPSIRPEFPLRRWVRLTVYMHYQSTTGFVQVWLDGVPMLRAHVSQLGRHPGTQLRTAHWGMYAAGTLDHGVQYNDDIRICTLEKPLTDFIAEPLCPSSKSRK